MMVSTILIERVELLIYLHTSVRIRVYDIINNKFSSQESISNKRKKNTPTATYRVSRDIVPVSDERIGG